MAPSKKTENGNSSIFNFFIPRSKWRSNAEPEEEIVVSSRSNSAEAGDNNNTPASSRPASVTGSGPVSGARKRGRPRKHAVDVASSSSQGTNGTPRKRGRPKKSESQSMRDEQLGARSSSLTSLSQTPWESDPRYNINALSGAADISPTPDSPYRSPAQTPSKRRLVQAVEISSSPIRPSSLAMGSASSTEADTTVPADADAAANDNAESRAEDRSAKTKEFLTPPLPQPSQASAPPASFSSISTLTTVPPSSALSTLPKSSSTSSRLVIKDGLKGVLNSDSEDDSSGDELVDPSSFWKPKQAPSAQASTTPNIPSKPSATRESTGRADEMRKRKVSPTNPASPPQKRYKNSLANILKDHEEAEASAAAIASMESAIEESRKKEEELDERSITGKVNEKTLLAAAGSDSDEQERMMMAIDRTEALLEEERFYFFLDQEPQLDFAIADLPDGPWRALFEDETSRREACISGLAAELALTYPLPANVFSWMATRLLHEKDEVLCEAYIEILRASSTDDGSVWNSSASLSSMYKTRSLSEHNWKGSTRSEPPLGLEYLVQVIQFCAPALDRIVLDAGPLHTSTAFLDFALMSVDEHVKENNHLSTTITKCMVEMLDALPEESFRKLIPQVVGLLFFPSDISPHVQYRAISSLPASTERSNELRRRLALECFSIVGGQKNSDSQNWATSILHALKEKPALKIASSTDYTQLRDLILVLDIAVSAGWTDWSQLQRGKPKGPFGQQPPPSAAEKLHNEQIDAISARLTSMMHRIKDAGTSHLRRMEAKNSIELLIKRLQYSVRSRPKPKKSVFGTGQGAGFMLRQATLNGALFGESVDALPQVSTPSVFDDDGADTLSPPHTPEFLPDSPPEVSRTLDFGDSPDVFHTPELLHVDSTTESGSETQSEDLPI